jgi:hypothetical protein
MAVPGAPYPANVLALLPHYCLTPGLAAQDQQNPTATEVGQYHTDVDDWRLELTAQLLVIAPGFHTNAQWPARLPAAANQVARLAKVAEIDNFIGVFMPEYSNHYQHYGQAMMALIPPAPATAATAPVAAAATAPIATAATAVPAATAAAVPTAAATAVPAAAAAAVPTAAVAALVPGSGQIGPPPRALPPPWHHLYMAGQQYIGPPPPGAPRHPLLPGGFGGLPQFPPQPQPVAARNPKPE